MKLCECVSCSISRALENKEIPKELADMFLLGYHYYGMTHEKEDVDAGWHAEGVEFYSNEILKKEIHKETMPDFAVIRDALKIAEQKDKMMAHIVENDKGFLIIKCRTSELMTLERGVMGVCDYCNKATYSGTNNQRW